MRKTIFVTFAVILIILVLITCNCSNTISGGTGTETVNTFALLPNGEPAREAHVQIIDARWWLDSMSGNASPVLAQAYTDRRGYCSIHIPKRQGQINIQIDNGTSGLLMPVPVQNTTDLGTVTLHSYATLSGTFATNSNADRVAIGGTAYTTPVAANRSFYFEKIPPGTFSLLGIQNSGSQPRIGAPTVVTIAAGRSQTLGTFSPDSTRLLIDNFEAGIGPTSLGTLVPVLGWYILSDSLFYIWNPDIRFWEQRPANIFGHSVISVDSLVEGDNNHVFTFSTKLDPDSFKANALAGLSFKPLSKEGIDLSKMTSFSFSAWGNGVVRVRFRTVELDTSPLILAGLSHYTYCATLSSTPHTFTIPVDSMRILDPTIYSELFPWSRVSKHVLRIEFNYSVYENLRNEKLTMYLDDLYFEGVTWSSISSSFTK